jgi:hypothetical protein
MIPLKGSNPFKKHRGFILSHWQQNKNSEDGYSRCFFQNRRKSIRRCATSSRAGRHSRIQN